MPQASAQLAPRVAVYERHRPERTLLYQLVARYYPEFSGLMAAQGTPLPGYVTREFEDYLKCGRLEHGFLRTPSALDLDVHFHMLFLDGVYLTRDTGDETTQIFRRVNAPTKTDLEVLLRFKLLFMLDYLVLAVYSSYTLTNRANIIFGVQTENESLPDSPVFIIIMELKYFRRKLSVGPIHPGTGYCLLP